MLSNNKVEATVAVEKVDKAERLVKPSIMLEKDGVAIAIDTTNVNYNTLQDVPTSDKGNRTIIYEKWTNGGITYQLTGYVTSKSMEDFDNLERTKKAAQLAQENQVLKQQMAEFQQMMGNPEFRAMMEAFKNK